MWLSGNTIFNGEKMTVFLLKSELSSLLLNIVLKVITKQSIKKKEIKGNQTGREEEILSLYADDKITIYRKPKNSTHTHTQNRTNKHI